MIFGLQRLTALPDPSSISPVQFQQKKWKFVGAQQFCPTMGREGVLEEN